MVFALPIADAPDIRPDHITGPRDIRAVQTLRISVTDRCNFRCVYCMPEEKLDWVPRDDLLSFEEIVTIARAAIELGITSFKLTGGEPLIRHHLPELVAMLRALPGLTDLSMTTNGALLDQYAAALKSAGLNRLTVSMDTQNRDRFRDITRGADLDHVWRGIRAAVDAGFAHPKMNCVAMKGINDDEYADFAALTMSTDLTVRFIEYMPLGRTALGGEYETRFISESEIRRHIEDRFGPLDAATRDTGHGPAIVWKIPGAKGRIGFISAMSKPFCAACNRLRLTAEGQLRSCLFDGGEVELRPIVRSVKTTSCNADLRRAFINCVAFKPEVHSYYGNRQMSQIGG
ncbi:MAG: GTP 3',8-cyclase MoaA [Planctomycetota bacterium]